MVEVRASGHSILWPSPGLCSFSALPWLLQPVATSASSYILTVFSIAKIIPSLLSLEAQRDAFQASLDGLLPLAPQTQT